MLDISALSALPAGEGALVFGEYNIFPTLNAGPQPGPVGGPGGTAIYRFAWIDSQGRALNARAALGDALGIVLPPFSLLLDWRRVFFDETTETFRIRQGLNLTMLAGGNVQLKFPLGARMGERVYANLLDGSPISGESPAGELTRWSVLQDAPPGALALISTWSIFP